MKKITAIFLMCIFAFAFTAVRATDTSPGHQKFSIEKTTLQTPAAFASVNQPRLTESFGQGITEIPVFSFIFEPVTIRSTFAADHNSQYAAQASQTFLSSNVIEKETQAEIYHSPGWLLYSPFTIHHSPFTNKHDKKLSKQKLFSRLDHSLFPR